MYAVRFHQSGCVATCSGLLHCEGGQLRLEYQYADNFLGLIKSDVKQVEIRLADIHSIDLVEGVFRTNKIVIQAKDMQAVRAVPGMKQGRVELLIARADREAARDLIEALHKPEPHAVGLAEL